MTLAAESPPLASPGKRDSPGRMKKVLVLVLSFDKEPYRSIELDGQRKTWVTMAHPDAHVMFYYGVTRGLAFWLVAAASKLLHKLHQPNLRSKFLRGTAAHYKLHALETADRITIQIPDFYGNVGAKTIGAMRHVLKHYAFDYLFRTNTSSYVHLPLLRKFIQTLPETGYYGGLLGQYQNMPFVGGAGILLSRDLIEFAAYDKHWDWDLMDDLAIARSMARAGVSPRPFTRIDVLCPEQVQLVPAGEWRTCFHVRCKSESDRLLDISTMNCVHNAYRAAGCCS